MRVFKYRGGSKSILHRDLLSLVNNQIFSTPIEKLNDPFEAQVDVDGETFRFGKILSLLPGARYNTVAQAAEDKFLKDLSSFVEKTKTFGIYSLSKTPTDELLWAYYANGHDGFCIEYDLDQLCEYKLDQDSVVSVEYQVTIPVLSANDLGSLSSEDANAMFTKLLGTKSKRWEHEQEIRILIGRTGLIEYDYRAVKGIYFGYRCSSKFQRLVMRVMAGRGIQYHRMEPIENSYRLQVKKMPDLFIREIDYRKRVAPVGEGVPHFDEKLEPYRTLVLMAIEIVRREPYCEMVTDAYLSGSKSTPDNPVIYVTYDRSDGIKRNYYFCQSQPFKQTHQ